jgi:hypothetical protein
MKRTSILPVLLLVSLASCDANDADTDTDDAPPAAATARGADAELAEVSDYELTMDKVDRLLQAQINLARAASRMTPAEIEALEAEAEAEAEDSDNPSLDDMAANLERHPAAKKAVEDAGISAREYATASLALMQAGMAMSVLSMRPNDNQDSLIREMQANPDNVRFLRENMAEITRRQQAAQQEMERLMPDEE